MELVVASSSLGEIASPQRSLEDAIEEFQSVLTIDQCKKLDSIGAIRDAQTVMIFTAQLDRENQLRKGRGVASRLYSVLQSVQAFSNVVGTFASSSPAIAALVWGSVKLTMLLAINFTSYFEALSGLFMAFSQQCPRFAEYQALYPNSSRLQKALCDFHASLIRCCKHVIEAIQRPWQKQVMNAFRQSFDQEFRSDLNDIQKLGKEVKAEIALERSLVDRQDQDLQEKERMAASKTRLKLKSFIPKVERQLSSVTELQLQQSARRSREERQRLLQSLSSHDHFTPFREACKRRQCGTAKWIHAVPEFTRWYDGTGSPLLWCSGKIGSGKTILCANTITHVFANKGCDGLVAFFFLQYDNTQSLLAETIIRSIVRQSIDPMAVSEDIECQLRELDQKIFVELKEWVNLLRRIMGPSNPFYIFIDGLDECNAAERRALLDSLSSLARTALGLRIFITSRDSVYMDLKSRFLRMERVSMTPKNLISDIRLYVDEAIQERIHNEDLMFGDPCLLKEIKDTLTQHADGMFLWVSFLISEICTGSCDDDIRQSLRTLPRDLKDTFNRALFRILSRNKMAQVQKVFRWVAAAKQPLTLDEMREAVSVDIGQTHSRPEKLVHGMRGIIFGCENLLQLTDEEPQLVQFAHSTIRNFITQADLPEQLSCFHVDLEEADHFAGEVCVTYLHLGDFQTTLARRRQSLRVNPVAMVDTALSQGPKAARVATFFTDLAFKDHRANADLDPVAIVASYNRADTDTSLERLQQSHPFLKYAVKHWISHSAKFQEGRSITWSLWHQITTGGHALAHIPWQGSTYPQSEHAMLDWSHRMHHYALLRYASSVTKLPEHKANELFRKSASEGDSEAIEIFMAEGCSISCINSALQAASAAGHLQVLERLLNADANVNAAATGYEGRTALQAASGGSHLHVVERLLDAGADVNARATDDYGLTALQAASVDGHLQVVERLLDAGADVNAAATGYKGRTALQAASAGGHFQVVERLLDAGASVNAAATGYKGRTALQAASSGGHLRVLELLINAGAKVNAKAASHEGRTALQAASAGGHLQAVEFLLGVGADVNARAASHDGRTALQAASEAGYLQVVERLLAVGADINAKAANYDGRTALQAASAGGHLQVVERLLSVGSDVNAKAANDWGLTALQAASASGHLQVIERLLDAGADVDAEAARHGGHTALQAASEAGHLEVVERLLSVGADVNAKSSNDWGRTALQAASKAGHLHVVERLLKAGANVNGDATYGG